MSDNAAFYEAFAPSYEAHYHAVDATAAVQQWLARMEYLKLVPDELARRAQQPALLDLGCGPGWHLREWRASNFSVAGMDVSPSMLRLARRNWDVGCTSNSNLHLFCADIRESSQFESLHDVYRVIVAHFNFLNLFTPIELGRVFTSIFALLAPGGMFVTDLALPAAAAEEPAEATEAVPRRERRWLLPQGELLETYWFHSVDDIADAATHCRLVVADTAAWLATAQPPYFAPLADNAAKLWLALRKLQ